MAVTASGPVKITGAADTIKLNDKQRQILRFQAEALHTLSAEELGDSMYLFYQQRFGVWIARVEDRLAAAPAPAWAAPPCGLAKGACAGFIERLSWTATNVLAEYSQTWFDPAVCRYSSRLSQ